MILIAGDSWGCGEWSGSSIQHAGLSQYFAEDGHNIINLSRPGGSNYDIWSRIDDFLLTNPHYQIEKIFIFQTEWERELLLHDKDILDSIDAAKLLNSVGITYVDPKKRLQDQIQIDTANGLGCFLILNFYQQLSRLSLRYNIPFYIIGGCSDAMPVDMPGVNIVCQSLTNLLVNDNHVIADPVYTFYRFDSITNLLKSAITTNKELEELVYRIELADARLKLFESNKNWFYPDGEHPNRAGHLKLYEFLKQNW